MSQSRSARGKELISDGKKGELRRINSSNWCQECFVIASGVVKIGNKKIDINLIMCI